MGELHANANIAMKGPMDGVSVTGRARIVHGTVYIPNGGGPRQVSTDDPAVLGVVDTSDVAMQKIVTTESPLMENMTIGREAERRARHVGAVAGRERRVLHAGTAHRHQERGGRGRSRSTAS